jgi:hypothetical protein
MRTFEDLVDVAVGFGGLDGSLDIIQDGAELEEGALGLAVLETLAGPAHFFLKMLFMPEEGRGAKAVDIAEGLKGMVPGQKREVDVLEPRM